MQDIFNSSKVNYSEFKKGQNTSILINFDSTINLKNMTVKLEENKTKVNFKNTISNNQSLPVFNKPEMCNQNVNNKYMIIKPDSFSGQNSIKHFFKQYKKAAEVNNWVSRQ